MKTIMLQVLSPKNLLYQGWVESITCRAVDGDLMILPGHIPYMNILAAGSVRLLSEDGSVVKIKHRGGILEVSSSNKASIAVFED